MSTTVVVVQFVARSFRYSCLVLVAIVANFSDLVKNMFNFINLIDIQNWERKKVNLPVSRIFGVYDFRQHEIRKSLSFCERSTLRNGRSKDGHFFAPGHCYAVLRVLGTRIYGSHNDKYMLKLGAYSSWTERQRTRFLEKQLLIIGIKLALNYTKRMILLKYLKI